MEWVAQNWPFVAGVGGVFITVGINVGMLWSHGDVLRDVRKEARELNGTVAEIKGSIGSCQAVQQLMLAGRIKEEGE